MIHLCRCERLDEAQFIRFRELVENEEEVDINCHTRDKQTPLLLLCYNNESDGLFDCVHLLFKRSDINVNQTDENGVNALMKLCWC